jgi:ketosteroid isomerase-like protein
MNTAAVAAPVTVVRSFFQALRDKSLEGIDAIFTEDVVYRVPHAPEGLPREIIGKATVRKMLAGAFAAFTGTNITDECHAVTDDPNLIFAQWTLDNPLNTGRRYINDGVSIFRLRDGRICGYLEYYNPAAAHAAFLAR